jgi:hypothetical protein
MRVFKLKNRFTGDIVLCNDMNNITESNGMKFVRVYKQENPNRTFLVNLEAFTILDK